MLKKKLLLKFFLIGLVGLLNVSVQAASPKYPLISSWLGEAWLTGKDGKRVKINGKQILQEKAVLETAAGSEIRIELDDKRAFVVLAESEISLPVISFDGGEAPVVFLRKGSLRWEQAPNVKGAYNTALRSDLFEFIAPPGDYVLSMDPVKAYASVKMLGGSLNFSAMNGEESVLVKTGQQVGFQGVLEEGEIAYDILLQGKKIPKGRLTEITKVDTSELGKREEAERRQKAAEAKKAQQAKAAREKAKREGYICEKPFGKFNQCAWICENNPKSEKKKCLTGAGAASCLRQRCNANGAWAEKIALDAEKGSSLCQAQPVIGPCDY